MKKQLATLFTLFFLTQSQLHGFDLELNTSYDYFRGIPDGSWNGNSGVFLSANAGECFCDGLALQLGGSYGLYNWDGRGNLVFKSSKSLEQQAFITVGASTSFDDFNAGLAYDCMLAKHFSIYDKSIAIDQLRFQTGYQFCSEEVGLWGTVRLNSDHKHALGVPVSYKAINQINLFWSHFFNECSMGTLWIGAPYGNSFRFHHKAPGVLTAGFSLRAALADCLFVDAHGSYMRARKASGAEQSRNYGANICVGLTYTFGGCSSPYGASYMSLGNNSNFLVDMSSNN